VGTEGRRGKGGIRPGFFLGHITVGTAGLRPAGNPGVINPFHLFVSKKSRGGGRKKKTQKLPHSSYPFFSASFYPISNQQRRKELWSRQRLGPNKFSLGNLSPHSILLLCGEGGVFFLAQKSFAWARLLFERRKKTHVNRPVPMFVDQQCPESVQPSKQGKEGWMPQPHPNSERKKRCET